MFKCFTYNPKQPQGKFKTAARQKANEKMSARKNNIANILVLGDNPLSEADLDAISEMVDEVETDARRYGQPNELSLAGYVHNQFDLAVL
jgi:hypothetical protein